MQVYKLIHLLYTFACSWAWQHAHDALKCKSRWHTKVQCVCVCESRKRRSYIHRYIKLSAWTFRQLPTSMQHIFVQTNLTRSWTLALGVAHKHNTNNNGNGRNSNTATTIWVRIWRCLKWDVIFGLLWFSGQFRTLTFGCVPLAWWLCNLSAHHTLIGHIHTLYIHTHTHTQSNSSTQ